MSKASLVRVVGSFDPDEMVRLMQWLAHKDCRIMRADPDLPLLYDSGAIYRIEEVETFSDYPALLAQGWEDCDSLAAARAGELLARGWRALRPGDGGYDLARKLRLSTIRAQVFMETRSPQGVPGTWHALVRYQVGDRWFIDDPSARLGMRDDRIAPDVVARWAEVGILSRVVREWAERGVDLDLGGEA